MLLKPSRTVQPLLSALKNSHIHPSHLTPLSRSYSQQKSAVDKLPARWLSDAKSRVEKCIVAGSRERGSGELKGKAEEIREVLERDWTELSAGSEGFLTGEEWAGLLGHRIAWGEEDRLKHVNNTNYNKWAESSRVNWIYNIAEHHDPEHQKEWKELVTPNGIGWILREIKVSYKFPMTWPDRISVFHKLRSAPGESADSFSMDCLVMSHNQQRPAARIVDDLVIYDYTRGGKTALKPFMVDMFRNAFELQEGARVKNSKRVEGILEDIKKLEEELL